MSEPPRSVETGIERFHELVDRHKGLPPAEDIRAFIRAKRQAGTEALVSGAVATLLIVGALVVLNTVAMPNFWKVAIFLTAFLVGGGLALHASTGTIERQELAKAEFALAQLVILSEAFATAERFVAGSPNFVLFLRSFDYERQGETSDQYALPYNYIGRMMGIPQPSREPDGGSLTCYQPFQSQWVHGMEALQAIRARLPVAVLDNLTLSAGKRAELEKAGVTCIAANAENWWEVFQFLAGRATLTVLFLGEASAMLVREMQFLTSSSRRYAVLDGVGTGDSGSPLPSGFREAATAVIRLQGAWKQEFDDAMARILEVPP